MSGALVCAACAAALPRSPAACPRCAVPMPVPETCGACLRREPAFDDALAALEYRFPADRLVQRFKFAGDLAAGHWLAGELARAARNAARPDLLLAPPLARSRLRERGFNQALELARRVGAELGLRVDPFALEKRRDTTPQPGLGQRERRANLRDAFASTSVLTGRHVAIVDDVMTTGATADAIARVAKAAGARRVSVWIAARTPDPRR